MKRLLSMLLSVVLILSLMPTAFAEDDMPVYKIKYNCSDFEAVLQTVIADVANGQEVTYSSKAYAPFVQEQSFRVNDTVVRLVPVSPTFKDITLPTIKASDSRNESYQSLDNYIRSNITYTQTSTEYDSALGTAPKFDGRVGSVQPMYVQTGGTYTVACTVDVSSFNVSLTVSEVSASTPDFYVSDGGIISCTPTQVEISTDRSRWGRVRDGDTIGAEYKGKTIYVRSPASDYYGASSYDTYRVKEDQDAPTKKLTLSANSYSVTIDNPNDFSGCEFSIDNKSWSSKTTFTNLESGTRYTVYARYPSDRYYFASSPVSSTVETTEGSKDLIEYTTTSTSDTIYYQATGTTQLAVSNKTLTADYSDYNISRLKTAVTNAKKRSDVVTTLDVTMAPEESDNRAYDKVKFTMPSGMGLLRLTLNTPWFAVVRSTETTSVQLTEGVTGTNSKVSDWKKGKTHLFTVNVNNGSSKAGSTLIVFPWTWPDRADLDGLEVGYCSTDGDKKVKLTYSVGTNGVQFTIPGNGYFYIKNLNRPYGNLPFLDSQTSWAYSYIYHAYETGLVNGTSATTFAPDEKLTKSQIVTLLARLAKYDPERTYCEPPYTDVDKDDWYYNALSYVYYRGALPKGVTEFEPDAPMTRADMCAMTYALFPYSGTIWTPFVCDDRDTIPTYALKAVDGYYTCGVINGTSATTFSPEGNLTRAEAVTILYRLQTLGYWSTL